MAAQTASKAAKKATQLTRPHATADDPGKAKYVAAGAEARKLQGAKSASNATESARPTTADMAGDESGNGKLKRAKKEKVVRDSFTMPKTDYERIALLKRKCLEAGVVVKKSELLRAGLQLLESAPPKRLLTAISALETVKTGRPAKGE